MAAPSDKSSLCSSGDGTLIKDSTSSTADDVTDKEGDTKAETTSTTISHSPSSLLQKSQTLLSRKRSSIQNNSFFPFITGFKSRLQKKFKNVFHITDVAYNWLKPTLLENYEKSLIFFTSEANQEIHSLRSNYYKTRFVKWFSNTV